MLPPSRAHGMPGYSTCTARAGKERQVRSLRCYLLDLLDYLLHLKWSCFHSAEHTQSVIGCVEVEDVVVVAMLELMLVLWAAAVAAVAAVAAAVCTAVVAESSLAALAALPSLVVLCVLSVLVPSVLFVLLARAAAAKHRTSIARRPAI